jgi:hypothetical protein
MDIRRGTTAQNLIHAKFYSISYHQIVMGKIMQDPTVYVITYKHALRAGKSITLHMYV